MIYTTCDSTLSEMGRDFMEFDGFCVSSTMACTRPGCWFQPWSFSNQRMRSWWIKIVRHPFKVLKPYNLEMIWNYVQDNQILGALFSDTSIYDDQHFCARSMLAADRHWTLQSESHPLAPNGARSGSAGYREIHWIEEPIFQATWTRKLCVFGQNQTISIL